MNNRQRNKRQSWEEAREPFVFAGGGDGIPTPTFCALMIGGGLLLLFIALTQGTSGWRVGENGSFAEGLLFFGSVISGVGCWLLHTRLRLLALKTVEEASELLGIEAEDLAAVAARQRVKPRYLVDGRPFYALSDFDLSTSHEAHSLLRASSFIDAQPHTLLRAAMTSIQVPAAQLLRADNSIPPVIPEYATSDEQEPATNILVRQSSQP